VFGLKVSTNVDGETAFLMFDAITAYSKSLTGSTTKHPVASGSTISDHFTADNPVIQITGVISVADLANSTLFRDEDNGLAVNAQDAPNEVQVNDNTSSLINLIPSSISQFLPDSNASVTLDQGRQDYKGAVDQLLENLMSGERYDEVSKKYKAALRTNNLYEFNHLGLISNITRELVLTSYSVKEDVDTGDCLICDLTFERVKFVKLRTTALPTDVVKGLKGKAAAKQHKGNVNSKPVTRELDEQDPLYNIFKPKAQSPSEFYNK